VKFKFAVASDCYSNITAPLFRSTSETKDFKIFISDYPPLPDCPDSIVYTQFEKKFSIAGLAGLTFNFLNRYNEVQTTRRIIFNDKVQSVDYLWKISFTSTTGVNLGDSIAVVYHNKQLITGSDFTDTTFVKLEDPSIIKLNLATYDSLYYNILYDNGNCNNCLNQTLFPKDANSFYLKKKIPEVIHIQLQ